MKNKNIIRNGNDNNNYNNNQQLIHGIESSFHPRHLSEALPSDNTYLVNSRNLFFSGVNDNNTHNNVGNNMNNNIENYLSIESDNGGGGGHVTNMDSTGHLPGLMFQDNVNSINESKRNIIYMKNYIGIKNNNNNQ